MRLFFGLWPLFAGRRPRETQVDIPSYGENSLSSSQLPQHFRTEILTNLPDRDLEAPEVPREARGSACRACRCGARECRAVRVIEAKEADPASGAASPPPRPRPCLARRRVPLLTTAEQTSPRLAWLASETPRTGWPSRRWRARKRAEKGWGKRRRMIKVVVMAVDSFVLFAKHLLTQKKPRNRPGCRAPIQGLGSTTRALGL